MIFDYRTQYHEYRRYIDLLKRKASAPVAQASLAVVGTLLLSALLVVVAIRPTAVTITELIRDLRTEETTVDQLDRKIRSLQIAQQRLETLTEKLAIANIAVPSDPELVSLSRRLEILASENEIVVFEIEYEHMQLRRVSAQAKDTSSIALIAMIPVRVIIGGSEEAVRGYILDAERLDRVASITKTILTSVSPDDRKERPFPVYATLYLDFYTTAPIDLPKEKQPSRKADLVKEGP